MNVCLFYHVYRFLWTKDKKKVERVIGKGSYGNPQIGVP